MAILNEDTVDANETEEADEVLLIPRSPVRSVRWRWHVSYDDRTVRRVEAALHAPYPDMDPVLFVKVPTHRGERWEALSTCRGEVFEYESKARTFERGLVEERINLLMQRIEEAREALHRMIKERDELQRRVGR